MISPEAKAQALSKLPPSPLFSPENAIGSSTPIEKKVRFSDATLDCPSSPGPSTSNQSSSSARLSLRIPANHPWGKATGIVTPVFVPFRTYQELRAAVDKCDHPDVATFHEVFDCWVKHYQCTKPVKSSENSLSWSDVYANYVFMACEFFIPRLCYEGREADNPVLFGRQLQRDEAISWIVSFLMGKVFGKKMITSRMQTLKKAFEKDPMKPKKPVFEEVWKLMEGTYLPAPNKNGYAKSRGKASSSRLPANLPSKNALHPFLVYLLGLDKHLDSPSKAFNRPAIDVSGVKPPRVFVEGWETLRQELIDKALETKDRKKQEAEAKLLASQEGTSSKSASSGPPKKAAGKRKCLQVSTPSKKRIVLTMNAKSPAVSKDIKMRATTRTFVQSSNDEDEDEDDEDEDDDDDESSDESSDCDSDDHSSVGPGTPTPTFSKMRPYASSSASQSPNRTLLPLPERPLLSAIPNLSASRSTLFDRNSDGMGPRMSIDDILGVTDRLKSMGDYILDGTKLEPRELEAVNALFDFHDRYRIHLNSPTVLI